MTLENATNYNAQKKGQEMLVYARKRTLKMSAPIACLNRGIKIQRQWPSIHRGRTLGNSVTLKLGRQNGMENANY